jgi:hypothetical protein
VDRGGRDAAGNRRRLLEAVVCEPVADDLWVDREAEQPALAVRLDRDLGQLAGLAVERQHAAGAFGDQRSAVGQEGDLPRHLEPGGERLDPRRVGSVVGRARCVAVAAAAGEQREGGDQRDAR